MPKKAKLFAENGSAQPSRSCLQMKGGDSRICCVYIFKSLHRCQGSDTSFWEIHSSSLICQQGKSVVQTVCGCASKVIFIRPGSGNNDRMGQVLIPSGHIIFPSEP